MKEMIYVHAKFRHAKQWHSNNGVLVEFRGAVTSRGIPDKHYVKESATNREVV